MDSDPHFALILDIVLLHDCTVLVTLQPSFVLPSPSIIINNEKISILAKKVLLIVHFHMTTNRRLLLYVFLLLEIKSRQY